MSYVPLARTGLTRARCLRNDDAPLRSNRIARTLILVPHHCISRKRAGQTPSSSAQHRLHSRALKRTARGGQ